MSQQEEQIYCVINEVLALPIAEYNKQIEELEYTIPEKVEHEEKLLLLSDAFVAIRDEDLDAETKNEFLKRMISRIEFSRENGAEFILDIDLHQ